MEFVNQCELKKELFNLIKEKLNFECDQEIDSFIKKLIDWLVEDMYLIMNSKKPVDTYTKEEFNDILDSIKPYIINVADYYTKSDINKIISDFDKSLNNKVSFGEENLPTIEEVKNQLDRIYNVKVNPIDSYTKDEFDSFACAYKKDNLDNIESEYSVVSVKKANDLNKLFLILDRTYTTHIENIANIISRIGFFTNNNVDDIVENIPKAISVKPSQFTKKDPNLELKINKLTTDNLSIHKLCVSQDSKIYVEDTDTLYIYNQNAILEKSVNKLFVGDSITFEFFGYTNSDKSVNGAVMHYNGRVDLYIESMDGVYIDKIFNLSDVSYILSKGKTIFHEGSQPQKIKYGLITAKKMTGLQKFRYDGIYDIKIDGDKLNLSSYNIIIEHILDNVYNISKGFQNIILFEKNSFYMIGEYYNNYKFKYTIQSCSNIIAVEPVCNYVYIVYDNKISTFDTVFRKIITTVYANSECNFKYVSCSSDCLYIIDENNNAFIYDAYYEKMSEPMPINDNIIGIYYDENLDRALAYSNTSIYAISYDYIEAY